MKKLFVILFILLLIVATVMIAKTINKVPKGWTFKAPDTSLYEVGTDNSTSESGKSCAYVLSRNTTEREFGNLMQAIRAKNYLGKRLQLTAYIKTKDVNRRVQMWMRVDGEKDQKSYSLSFDNMGNRPVTGTSDWKQYSIVLDVPENSSEIYYGFLIAGTGEMWIDNVKVAEVDKTVPATNMNYESSMPTAPVNLDFEE